MNSRLSSSGRICIGPASSGKVLRADFVDLIFGVSFLSSLYGSTRDAEVFESFLVLASGTPCFLSLLWALVNSSSLLQSVPGATVAAMGCTR